MRNIKGNTDTLGMSEFNYLQHFWDCHYGGSFRFLAGLVLEFGIKYENPWFYPNL